MINRTRLRALLAPTADFGRATGVLVVGIVFFTIGCLLSFESVLSPILESIGSSIEGGISVLVRPWPQIDADVAAHAAGGILLLTGFVMCFAGGKLAFRRLLEVINPDLKGGVRDLLKQRQRLAYGPRIVTLGGGTGLSTLLRGLKNHSSNITAIVTVTDDGGSSGRLVAEKGMIPPGDIRNCLVALADAETSMTALFQHRFKHDSGTLSGHSMGNLLIAALVDQASGDFEKAVGIASDVLNIRGNVVPSTLDHVGLRAVLEDGREVCGETAIVASGSRIRRIYLDPANCTPHPMAIKAIQEADLICIGPGSVYTSVIPNLLVPGIAQALRDSKVPRVYICNVMTQPGESDRFTASEHVTTIQLNVEKRIFDHVLVNTAMPSQSAIEKYRGSGQHVVDPDIDVIRTMGFRTVVGNFISETDVVRHDPARAAARLIQLASKWRSR